MSYPVSLVTLRHILYVWLDAFWVMMNSAVCCCQ